MSLTSIAIAYMPPRLFQCSTAASVHLFSDSSMHNQSIDVIEISYERLLIYRTCYVDYQSMMHPVHDMTLSCNLYILSNTAVCYNQWYIQCMLAMLLPVDNFKVLRDVVLYCMFTCCRSTLLTLYFINLRYIPLIYVACSTCYQYTMILIKLGLHVTNMRMHVTNIAINN
jgi:hypothetical protein